MDSLVQAWIRRKVASALFEDWARRKYPKVRNPKKDGRKDEITFDTLLGYSRSGDAGAQRMIQQMRAEYAREHSEGAQIDMWPDYAAKTDEDFEELVGGYEEWSRPELDAFLKAQGAETSDWKSATGSRMVNFEHDGERYVGEEDDHGNVSVQTAESFLDDAISYGRVFDYVEEENFNDEFWESPPPAYHGTSEEAWEEIRKSGLEARAETRGIGNRDMGSAVFTSLDTFIPSQYGDVIVKIDTEAMKRDGLMPEAGRESPLIEADAAEALAHRVGVEGFYADREEGLDPDTVAFYANIPARYLERVE